MELIVERRDVFGRKVLTKLSGKAIYLLQQDLDIWRQWADILHMILN
jgi:hypothetical protein